MPSSKIFKSNLFCCSGYISPRSFIKSQMITFNKSLGNLGYNQWVLSVHVIIFNPGSKQAQHSVYYLCVRIVALKNNQEEIIGNLKFFNCGGISLKLVYVSATYTKQQTLKTLLKCIINYNYLPNNFFFTILSCFPFLD